jgi:hypothetical protein
MLTRGQLRTYSLPNGADFQDHNVDPDQHIYRALNPGWVPPPPAPTISKFSVRQHLHQNRGYWSPYDLLGLFLSMMGPAPAAATKRNFYLPLTAVYGRWCRLIASHAVDPNGVGNPPYCFQCTWREEDGRLSVYSLGASLEGWSYDPVETGTWKTVVQRARFDLIWNLPGNPLQSASYTFDTSPVISRNGANGTKFGNCSETYPYLNLLV